jgi:hypothetical protein
MGIGRMWSPTTGWGNASDVLEQNGLSLIEYKPKEVRERVKYPFLEISMLKGINNDQWNTIYYSIRGRR